MRRVQVGGGRGGSGGAGAWRCWRLLRVRACVRASVRASVRLVLWVRTQLPTPPAHPPRVALTHFSGRYPAVPKFGEQHRGRATIAMDFMSVNMADLPRLPAMLGPLEALFSAELAEFAKEEEGERAGGGGAEAAAEG